jgi:tetratricopeptide (TPR) repeat protein
MTTVAQHGEPALKRAAITDLTLFYPHVGRPDKAFEFFDRLDHDRVVELMHRIGEHYIDLGKYSEAISILGEAALRDPDPMRACEYHVLRLQAALPKRLGAETITIADDLAKARGSADCQKNADALAGEIVGQLHAEYGKTLNPDSIVVVAKLYASAMPLATTAPRRDALARNRAIATWQVAASAKDPGAALWVAAAEALQAPNLGADAADAALDAWDNAIRAPRRDAALTAKIRAGLSRSTAPRAAALLKTLR